MRSLIAFFVLGAAALVAGCGATEPAVSAVSGTASSAQPAPKSPVPV